MRKVAQVVGIVWIVASLALWLWLGFAQPLGRVDGDRGFNWSVLTLLSDSQFGLTAVALALAGIGYAIFAWGRRQP